jgi:outer membrane cobalamin receptor
VLRVAACVKSGWTKPVKVLCASSTLALGAMLSAASVLAEEPVEAEYGASAHAVRPLAARNDEDATAAATVIELTERPMALESLREVVHEVPGALALSSGGYGAFSSVSLRGAEQGQTVWLLGDVPLNGPDTGAFDISLLPLAQFERLEVYRSGAPVWLGQGSIGGVARVVPREGAESGVSAQLGAGSFGRYELRGNGYVTRMGKRPVSLFTGVQATHAGNEFPYLDDNATRFRRDDDRERRLRNADVLEGAGILHLRVSALGGHLDLVAHAIEGVGVGKCSGV